MTARTTTVISWIARLTAAVILGQTLFFKLTGAPESVYIFSTLNAEPWGRYGIAAAELLAVILLLVPRTAPFGGLLGAGLMVGALGAHLGPLGIEVAGDGGLLFGLGVVVLAAALTVVGVHRHRLVAAGKWVLDRISGRREASV